MDLLASKLFISVSQAHCFHFSGLALKKNHQHLITYLNPTEDAFLSYLWSSYFGSGKSYPVTPQSHAQSCKTSVQLILCTSLKDPSSRMGTFCSPTHRHHRTLFVHLLTSALTKLKDTDSTVCRGSFQ